jgi:hypothetical protein
MGTSELARHTCCAHRRANRKLTAWRGTQSYHHANIYRERDLFDMRTQRRMGTQGLMTGKDWEIVTAVALHSG